MIIVLHIIHPTHPTISSNQQASAQTNHVTRKAELPREEEQALNLQINLELQASYVYLSLHAYFARDDVALPGLAKFFLESSHEEREHAEKLIKYMTMRGGRFVPREVKTPETEFEDPEKGDALNAMETALSLEKAVNQSLLALQKTALDHGDAQMCDFIEGEFLKEQVEGIQKLAGYMAAQEGRARPRHLGLDHELSD